MFSGKTSQLISEYKKFSNTKTKVICLKPLIDNRYSKQLKKKNIFGCDVMCSKIISHDDKKIDAYIIDSISDETMEKIIDGYDLFIIDELQFIKKSREFITKLLNKSKMIIASGLNGDFNQVQFNAISDVIPIASDLFFNKSICYFCNGEAPYTIRKNKKTKKKVIIGGDELYCAVCLKCVHK